ncbi:MAG TPA: dihydrodipicolinate synthase family protein [Spirochaetales bacterium]|nr:dihydrodipicolinate synthase family protein [Spirochaetales bacterium]
MSLKFTAKNVRGIFNIMPTPAIPNGNRWDCEDSVDYVETARIVNMLVDNHVDAILTNGTFGEGATLTESEWRKFNEKVITTAKGKVPVFSGATTLNTRDTIRRAKEIMSIGATGLFLGRPMWQEMDEDAIVGYYSDIAEALPDAPIIVYDNPEAFKGKMTPRVYGRLAKIPNVIASKYISVGQQYLADVEAAGDNIIIMPLDSDWYFAWKWAPEKAKATWTGSGNCGMAPLLALKQAIESGDDAKARTITFELRDAYKTLFPHGNFHDFSIYNIQIEKTRFNAAGLVKCGPSRPPYNRIPEQNAEGAILVGKKYAALQEKYSRR